MYSFRRRARDAELSRLRAENAEMRSRIGRLVEEKAVLRGRLKEMSSFKRTPVPGDHPRKGTVNLRSCWTLC